MCKKHFLDFVKYKMRREFRNIYRDPETSYAALDFFGTGKVSMKLILEGMVAKRLKFTE